MQYDMIWSLNRSLRVSIFINIYFVYIYKRLTLPKPQIDGSLNIWSIIKNFIGQVILSLNFYKE